MKQRVCEHTQSIQHTAFAQHTNNADLEAVAELLVVAHRQDQVGKQGGDQGRCTHAKGACATLCGAADQRLQGQVEVQDLTMGGGVTRA